MKAPIQVNENKGDSKGFQSPKAGKTRAWLYRMVDQGTQSGMWKGTPNHKRKIMFLFELIDQKMEDGRPLVQPITYNFSMYEKANLCKDIDNWLDGEAYEGLASPEDFEFEKLYDIPCELTLEAKGDSVYVTKLGRVKSEEGITPRCNDIVTFSIDDFDKEKYSKFSDKMKARIALSPEYQALTDEQKKPYDKVEEVMVTDTATADAFKQAEESIVDETSVPY